MPDLKTVQCSYHNCNFVTSIHADELVNGKWYCPGHQMGRVNDQLFKQPDELGGLGEANCRECGHPVICELDEVGSGGVSCHRCEFKRYEAAQKEIDDLTDRHEKTVLNYCEQVTALKTACDLVGKWLSAALDDPKVCDEMKADIRKAFELRGDD